MKADAIHTASFARSRVYAIRGRYTRLAWLANPNRVFTLIHVRRTCTSYRCTAYMYHSVNIHRTCTAYMCAVSNYDDIGHKPYRPRPYRPQKFHIGHKKCPYRPQTISATSISATGRKPVDDILLLHFSSSLRLKLKM